MKIKYEAEDGTLFDKEQDCREYEYLNTKKEELKSAIDFLKNFCINMECSSCPYRNDIKCKLACTPDNWEVED